MPDLPTVPDAEAEPVALRRDCLNDRRGGLHCSHFQEGDGHCCDCGQPNWRPAGGVI